MALNRKIVKNEKKKGKNIKIQIWAPGVNFIIIFKAAFQRADPKSVKKTDCWTVFF
jgi:hypothetical protein